jgi:NADPH:quinone reductase-like Zn-dependent oxidoreductase
MPGGSLLGPLPFLLRVMLSSLLGGPRMKPFAAKPNPEDLAVLAGMIESGQLRPVIDRTYGLADCAAALARQGEGHARGKTVVTVGA